MLIQLDTRSINTHKGFGGALRRRVRDVLPGGMDSRYKS